MSWDNAFRLLAIGVIYSIPIAVVWFWIKMLIEAASEREIGSRVIWLLIVFFGTILGAAIYSLMRLPRRIDEDLAFEDEKLLREFREESGQRS